MLPSPVSPEGGSDRTVAHNEDPSMKEERLEIEMWEGSWREEPGCRCEPEWKSA